MISPEEFLKLIYKEEEDVFKLGTIGDLTNNESHIIFDGESDQSKKAYLSVNYIPVKGDRVLLVKVKGTYLILGNIIK